MSHLRKPRKQDSTKAR